MLFLSNLPRSRGPVVRGGTVVRAESATGAKQLREEVIVTLKGS